MIFKVQFRPKGSEVSFSQLLQLKLFLILLTQGFITIRRRDIDLLSK